MRDSERDDTLDMAVLRGYNSRGEAEIALALLQASGIPAILTGIDDACIRVPQRFAEEAAELLASVQAGAGDWTAPRPIPIFWGVMLGLLAGTLALFAMVWVSDRVVGVFR
jgi:hypothetical protein